MTKRIYALYANGERISLSAMPKKDAVSHFQSALLFGSLNGIRMELKPVVGYDYGASGIARLKELVHGNK